MNQFKAEVDLALKAPDAANLQKTLDSILSMVDRLPGKGGAASGAVKEIVDQIVKIKTALQNTGSLNSVIGDVKALGAALKSLGTLQKGLELFSNKDIQNINQGTLQLQRAAKAAEALQRQSQIKAGNFGLDETKISSVIKATKSLQAELKGIQQVMASTSNGRLNANDPLFQQSLLIQKNIKALQQYQAELQRTADLTKYNEGIAKQGVTQKNQFIARQDGRVLAGDVNTNFATSPVGRTALPAKADFQNKGTARYADPDFVAVQSARRELSDLTASNRLRVEGQNLRTQDARLSVEARSLQQQINQKVKENTAELAKANGETEKTKQNSRDILALEGRLSLQRSQERRNNPQLREAAENDRINGMLSRVEGKGGAALLKVQAALLANYSLLTTVITGIQNVISGSIQLESSFRNIQAVTATTKTEMGGLEDKIKSIAGTSKFTAVEVSEAALVLGQAGLSAKLVADALPSVVTLAAAAGTSLANAVDLVTSIVGVFDKQASDTADVANKVTSASNNSKISVDKLALAFQYVGNAAAQTGVSFEETTAALATMSNAGIKSGSTLGTGLRQFLTELQKPTQNFLDALRRVGLGISDIDVKSQGFIGVIKNLRDAGFVASDAIQSFDVRSAAAFNALIANPEGLANQLAMLQNTSAAIDANRIQMDSFDSQAKRLTTTIGTAVATGLGPLQTALTTVMRSFADMLAVLGQYPSLLQGLITVSTLFVGVGIAKYLLGILGGAISLSGVLPGLAAGMRLASTATMEQAIATTALGRAAVASSVGVSVLGKAVLGLSILTGIGIVLGVVALSMQLFGGNSEKAAASLDKLKAGASDAKSAFDAKQAAVDSLSRKIEELTYKQNTLENNQQALKQVTQEVSAQFGNLGFQMDVSTNSASGLINKLRTLRSEMRGIADTKLALQLAEDRKVLEAQVDEVKQGVQKIGPQGSIGRSQVDRFENYLKRYDVLNSPELTKSQKDAIPGAISTLRQSSKPEFLSDKDTRAANIQSLAAAAKALEIVQSAIKGDGQRKDFDRLTKDMFTVIGKAGDAATQEMKVFGTKLTQQQREERAAFEKKPIFQGKTFEQAIPAFTDTQGKIKSENPGLEEVELFRRSKVVIEDKLKIMKGMENALQDAKDIPESAKKGALQELTSREEELRSQGKKYYSTVENRFKAETQNEVDRLNALARNKATPLEQRKEYLRQAGVKQGELLTAGTFGSSEREEALASQRRAVGEAKADALQAPKGASTTSLEKDRFKVQAAEFRMAAAAQESKAKGSKISATNAISLDEVDNFLDAGIQYLLKAKANKVKALIAEQNARILPKDQTKADNEAMTNEIVSMKEKADQDIENFVSGAAGIYKAVAKRTTKLGSKADAQSREADLKLLKSQAEDRLFAVQQPEQDIKLRQAQGLLPAGSTEEKRALLAITQEKIRALGEELASYTDDISSLTEAAKEARAKVTKYRGQLSTATDVNRGRVQAGLDAAIDEEKETSDRLRTAISGRNTARGSIQEQRTEEAALLRSLPQEASWTNISKRIDEAVENYRIGVESFNEVGMIGQGVSDTLNGLSGNFATFFNNIATRSMSAKDAFKAFAVSVIQSMLNIVTQALAMQAVKSLLGIFSNFITPAVGGGTSVNGSAGTVDMSNQGASGGEVVGGIPGKDSVSAVVMPGEFLVKKSAVDAVGLDFLHSLNSQTNSTISQAASGMSPAATSMSQEPKVTNIWVVSPDQKPSMGPQDVVLLMTDHMAQGSNSFKTLVKQVASGQA